MDVADATVVNAQKETAITKNAIVGKKVTVNNVAKHNIFRNTTEWIHRTHLKHFIKKIKIKR